MHALYEELIGFVPPRIMALTDLGPRLNLELLQLQEATRMRAMDPACVARRRRISGPRSSRSLAEAESGTGPALTL